MKIILISIGTRGDMEPFLAIGELLKQKGHQVICAFPEQFRNLAQDTGLEFMSLGSKFIELLESEDGKAAMGGSGSGLKKFLATVKLARNQNESQKELLHKQREWVEREAPDRIIYNGKAVFPIIWGLNHIGKNILICALPYIHYVKGHAHVAFNRNFGDFLNRLTYALYHFGMITTIRISLKWLEIPDKITRKQIKGALLSNKAIYTISPSLFSRPDYWGDNLSVLGFHERDKAVNWLPDDTLIAFLEKYQDGQLLFFTFGSMLNTNPKEKTGIIIDILERHHIPAIINTASGGLVEPVGIRSELVYFVPRIPYDWIFPRVYGVVHHGGSGTTHLALKYGCASMIIPHIIDQFVWDQIVYDIGAGPKGIKISKINSQNLEPKILELCRNRSYKQKAEQVAAQMGKEDFREELVRSIVE